MSARDWDAASYDRVSTPQVEMARPVLGRLPLEGHETVLDAGCGSGRVTAVLLERLPLGSVVAVDAAPSMIEQARERFASEPRVRVLDPVSLTDLELPEPVDAAFSNAVFHHIEDHDVLFARLHAALRPRAHLVAQCGGKGNIDQFRRLADEVAAEDPFAEHMRAFVDTRNFASPEDTERRLRRAGFTAVSCWLEPWPVRPDEPVEFVRTLCLGYHLEELPEDLREPFTAEVVRRCGLAEAAGSAGGAPTASPLELDYIRLNITARRP